MEGHCLTYNPMLLADAVKGGAVRQTRNLGPACNSSHHSTSSQSAARNTSEHERTLGNTSEHEGTSCPMGVHRKHFQCGHAVRI